LRAFPVLQNKDEVFEAMRRFYPLGDRAAGVEADVLLMVHIGADGRVWKSDVVRSASPAFDAAAQKAAEVMRFSPAIGLNGKPAPVRLAQPMGFRLEAQ
jgi:TonB family protein